MKICKGSGIFSVSHCMRYMLPCMWCRQFEARAPQCTGLFCRTVMWAIKVSPLLHLLEIVLVCRAKEHFYEKVGFHSAIIRCDSLLMNKYNTILGWFYKVRGCTYDFENIFYHSKFFIQRTESRTQVQSHVHVFCIDLDMSVIYYHLYLDLVRSWALVSLNMAWSWPRICKCIFSFRMHKDWQEVNPSSWRHRIIIAAVHEWSQLVKVKD